MELSMGCLSYLETALWSTVGYTCENLEDKYSIYDISEEFKKQSQKDYDKFYSLTQNLFTENELDFKQIGHDFWLTRNGHGAGFWDGDYKNGDKLTKIVTKYFPANYIQLVEDLENQNFESNL